MPIESRKTQYAIRGWGGNGFQPGDTSGPWIVAVWYIICYSKASLVCLGTFLPQTLEANVRKQFRLLKFRRRKEEQFEKKKEKKKEAEETPRVASLCVHLFITVAIYKSCAILLKARERRLVPLISRLSHQR